MSAWFSIAAKRRAEMSELIAGAKARMPSTARSFRCFGAILILAGGGCRFRSARFARSWRGAAARHQAQSRRPSKQEIRHEQLQSIERSWKPQIAGAQSADEFEPKDRKPYIRAILYAARLIYSWDNLASDPMTAPSNICTSEARGLDLKPIDMALACRQERDDVFKLTPTRCDARWACSISYRAAVYTRRDLPYVLARRLVLIIPVGNAVSCNYLSILFQSQSLIAEHHEFETSKRQSMTFEGSDFAIAPKRRSR